jgi:hypothetical protein
MIKCIIGPYIGLAIVFGLAVLSSLKLQRELNEQMKVFKELRRIHIWTL